EADLVGLGRVPREVEATRTLLARSDTVLPAVARDEVAARVPDGADAELLHELDDVGTEPVFVGCRVAGLVEPVVDAAAEVLHEGAEDPPVDRGHNEMRVEGEMCGDQRCLNRNGWID